MGVKVNFDLHFFWLIELNKIPSSVWGNDNYIGLKDYQRKRDTILGKNVTPLF